MMICERLHVEDPSALLEWPEGLRMRWRGHVLNRERQAYGRPAVKEDVTLGQVDMLAFIKVNRERSATGNRPLTMTEFADGAR